MSKLRYYDSASARKSEAPPKAAIYTEFLRTGRINRRAADWNPVEKRYLTHDEVAARTAKKLETAGDTTHHRINAFHPSIRFPKLLFQRTLKGSPHLGYCHVTAAKTQFAPLKDIKWSFYIANFYADIGDSEQFFERINLGYSRMYFAVAIDEGEEIGRMVINRTLRSDGLLFRTHDPKVALKNVLQLGARNEQLRKIIRSL